METCDAADPQPGLPAHCLEAVPAHRNRPEDDVAARPGRGKTASHGAEAGYFLRRANNSTAPAHSSNSEDGSGTWLKTL